MIELISLAIFFLACVGMAFMIRRKMPLLRSVPEQLMEESFVTRPQRAHAFLERMKTLYQEQYHHYLIFSFLERLILGLRNGIAQVEQGLFWLLRHVRERQNSSGSSSKHLRYLNRLNAWKKKNGNGVSTQKEGSSPVDDAPPPQ